MEEDMKQKGFSAGILLLIITVVGVGGYLIYQNQNKSTIQRTNQLSPIQIDETANQKTYTGDSFSFKYPNDWFVYKLPSNNIIGEEVDIASCNLNKNPNCGRDKNQITIVVRVITDKTNPDFGAIDIEDYYQKKAKSFNSGKNRKDIILDGQPAIRFSTVGGPGDMEGVQGNGDTVVVEYKDNLYIITSSVNIGSSGKSDNLGEAINIFDKVLSTFKFTQ